MAAFEHFGGMYDVALKPRLLNTLVMDYLPDNKNKSFTNPSMISEVESLIKTHRLLSESFILSTDPKLVEAWKSAVTMWVDRVLSLIDSDTSDKCWVGVSLLGFTCQHCSSDRFKESYSLWFQKLLPFLQAPKDSFFVTVAACFSVSDLLTRLSGFPNLKKDGSQCALKVVQPALNLFTNCDSEALWENAAHVLCTIITSFPFAINRHYDSVESTIASKLLSGECSPVVSKKLAHCLALLPNSRGDAESWSVMLQKFLVVINDQLNSAFQGLEEEHMRNKVNRMLVLHGDNLPSPTKGFRLEEESSNRTTRRSEKSLVCNASTLMHGCCTMIANSYPVAVNVPVLMLLSFVERILMVNGSLPQMSIPFITAKLQEDICSGLPLLHMSTLELLDAIVKAVGSQLLSHASSVVRVIAKYFKTCALPELRIKFYSVTKTLILSMGIGMALYLTQDVVNNAFADLGTTENKSGGTLNGSKLNASTASLIPPNNRKRKSSNTTDSRQEHDGGGDLGCEVPESYQLTPISLRIAALEALETLITAAGSMKSEQWRSNVDKCLIVIAMDSFKEGVACEEVVSVFQQTERDAMTTDLQLAALRALLASLLSYARVRPPHLSEALDLFLRGRLEIGTKVADFCAQAILTVEVLLHPRGLPLISSSSFSEAQHDFQDDHARRSNRNPFCLPQAGHDSDTDDELCAKWMENANETDESLPKDTEHTEEPSVFSEHLFSGTKVQEGNEMVVSEAAVGVDVEMRVVNDEIGSKSDQPVEPVIPSKEPDSQATTIPAEPREAVATAVISERIVSDSTIPHNEGSSSLEPVTQSTSFLQRTSLFTMIQESPFKSDGRSSPVDEDGFPEIVDVDPDSDSDSD